MKKKTFLILMGLIIYIFMPFNSNAQLNWVKDTNNPVMEVQPGTWYSWNVMWPVVIHEDDTFKMWFCGNNSSSGRHIGYAESLDGLEWDILNDPVISSGDPGNWAIRLYPGSVLRINDTLRMWFCGSTNGNENGSIGYAWYDEDEDNWHSLPEPVLEPGEPGAWDDVWTFFPSVYYDGTIYHMYYTGSGDNFEIGYATSFDGINWEKDNVNSPVIQLGLPGSFHDAGVFDGHTIMYNDTIRMFFTGSDGTSTYPPYDSYWRIGYAWSTDYINWNVNTEFVVDVGNPGIWDESIVAGPSVLIHEDHYKMWYFGVSYNSFSEIGYALGDPVSNIIHVPGDQPTIQAAIDIATHGDTILVDEGTYYENINFMGKAITVASQFLMDGDESHIENTIIDGSQPINPDLASTVLFVSGEDTTSIITGFKITGGSGILNTTYNVLSGGGIAVENSGAKMEHNIITENHIEHINGAGGCGIGAITMDGSTWLVVRNNIITHNSALAHGISAFGGGIASTMNSIIENNTIEYNECENMDGTQVDGGGVEIEQIPGSFIYAKISGNTIRYNSLTVDYVAIGAGLIVYQAAADIIDNNISHNTVTANQFGNGAGIYVYDNLGEIIIENNEITGNEIISLDWARGAGIAFSQSTEKVEINNNTIEDNYMEGFNCRGSGIWFVATSGDLYIQENSIIHNIGPKYNINSGAGGGLCIMDAVGKLVIDKNIFIENTMYNGGGLYIRTSLNTTISNNFFRENDAVYGGGISYYNPSSSSGSDKIKLETLPLIVNNTIINNTSDDQGGGIRYNCQQILPVVLNSIIRFNSSDLGKDIYSNCINEMVISYSNVIEGDITGNWTGDENIESDPMVIDDLGHISNYSECIESGTLSLEISGEIYNCPDFDIDGQIRPLNATADIGADEVLITGVYDGNISQENTKPQISPNPSSDAIQLRFKISDYGLVICDLYEISGVKVKRLLNEEKTPGTFEMEIDLSDLPNGVYFITLKTKNGSQSTKLIKL